MAAAAMAAMALVCFGPSNQSPDSDAPSSHTLYVLQCVEQHVTYGGDTLLGQDVVLIDTTGGGTQ